MVDEMGDNIGVDEMRVDEMGDNIGVDEMW